jgi:Fe-Mn family superoxide dismutase
VRPTPDLVFDAEFRELGVGGLFSDTGYRLGWTTYQKMMLQKLDELLAGEPDENADVKALLLKYARDPQSASVFNHASMAFNNHFFYQALSTTPMKLDRYNLLEQSLTKTFGSIDTLRTTFLDTAAAMFAPGFVWLVWCKDAEGARAGRSKGAWRILSLKRATVSKASTPTPHRLLPTRSTRPPTLSARSASTASLARTPRRSLLEVLLLRLCSA